jgi:chaperonin GroES
MFDFVPIRSRVLVKRIEDDLKTKSGLTLSDDSKERPTKGKVLAVGEGKLTDNGTLIPTVIKVNNVVVYPKYAGHQIKINGEEYLILEEDEILGILIGEKSNG